MNFRKYFFEILLTSYFENLTFRKFPAIRYKISVAIMTKRDGMCTKSALKERKQSLATI